ncbi:MAG: DegV family protein [Anaerolineaceae bacterium]|jgi:DegV family protein with EDD domain
MIKIVTDSACDIPEDLTREYGINKVPTHIIWEGKDYLDSVTMTAEDFYKHLSETKAIPTSSQPSAGEFKVAFEQAVAQGAQEIICLTVSSALSGTFQAASSAALDFNIPVHVVDTRAVSMQQGWQVLAAARAARLDSSVHQILESIERVRQKVVLSVGLPSLSYLARSGRLGQAFKWIGSISLSVKPLVAVNADSGKIEPTGVVRTQKAMIEKVYSYFKQKIGDGLKLHVVVLHGSAATEANLLMERIRQDLDPLELLVTSTGPVLGAHTGPGTIGISGYYE